MQDRKHDPPTEIELGTTRTVAIELPGHDVPIEVEVRKVPMPVLRHLAARYMENGQLDQDRYERAVLRLAVRTIRFLGGGECGITVDELGAYRWHHEDGEEFVTDYLEPVIDAIYELHGAPPIMASECRASDATDSLLLRLRAETRRAHTFATATMGYTPERTHSRTRVRSREHRPAARRRPGASSRTSSADPGDPDPADSDPPRPQLTLAPPAGAIYRFACLSAEARGATVEAVAS